MVLSEKAMEHLRSLGTVVYIDVPFEEISRRVKNIRTRGIVFHPNETLGDVFRSRSPLYLKYSDIKVSVLSDSDIEETVDRIAAEIAERNI